MSSNTEMKWMLARPIAHRGLHNASNPENSIGAFYAGMLKGYNLELDVHLTQDNELAVVHDENLERMTGQSELITSCERKKWRSFSLLGTSEGIPTLDEVLKLVNGRVGLIIEIKSDKSVPLGKLEDILIEKLRAYKGDFAIKSFDPRIVKYIRKHAPEFICGQLSWSYKDYAGLSKLTRFYLSHLMMIPFNHAQFISYDINTLPCAAVTKYRKRGLPVLAWTISSPELAEKARAHCDNIIFEKWDPDTVGFKL